MKKLLVYSAIMILAVAYLTGCKQDPSSSNNSMPMTTTTTTTAHPAWTFTSSKVINHNTYYTVAVSDSDATNNTNVYTASSNTVRISGTTWSANGGSISFLEGNTIKAVDVTVTNGVPIGSNARTIYTAATGMTISRQVWCPASTNAKIAFGAKSSAGIYSIYTVSTSGGTATQIYNAPSGDIIGAISWSNDGTQIALAYKTGTTLEIKVIDASTGAESATLASGSGYLNIGTLAWSHSGSNTIAFAATKVSGGNAQNYKLYTIGTTTGSTETLLITGYNASWSPDNSELVYSDDSTPPAVNRKVTVGSGATSGVIGSYDISYIDWKQP